MNLNIAKQISLIIFILFVSITFSCKKDLSKTPEEIELINKIEGKWITRHVYNTDTLVRGLEIVDIFTPNYIKDLTFSINSSYGGIGPVSINNFTQNDSYSHTLYFNDNKYLYFDPDCGMCPGYYNYFNFDYEFISDKILKLTHVEDNYYLILNKK